MKQSFLGLAVLLALAFSIVACNEEETIIPATEELTATEDVVMMQNLIQDTEDEVDSQLEARGPENECPTRTVNPDDGSFPRTITIDYGEGCEGPNGRVRAGQIVVTVSDTLSNPGATRTITFVDFSIDNVQIEGGKSFTFNGNASFDRTASINITYPDGTTASWQGTTTLTQIEGVDTRILIDDVFELTGSASGTSRDGATYQSEIVDPIIKKKACPWVVSGVRKVNVQDRMRSIDFGGGGCDRFAEVTLNNGNTRTIRIGPWW